MADHTTTRRAFLRVAGAAAAGTALGIEAAVAAPHAIPALAPAVVAWYRFDETSGTSAADSSGNGRTATLAGGASWQAGRSGNAVNLSGSSQYVSMPAGLLSGLNDFSIATWVRLDTVAAWQRIFDFGSSTTVNMFLTPQSGSGTLRFVITTGGAGAEQQINAVALGTGSWRHVAVTLAGNTGILYVDGVEVGRNTAITLRPSSLGNTSQNWLGRSQYAADGYLDGQLDDLRIYGGALTAAEVYSLYNPGGTPNVPAYVETIHATGWRLQSTFWNARIKNMITNWLPHCYNTLSDLNLPEGGINNFIQAARKLSGQSANAHLGFWFSNAYVHNTVEAMCNALMIDPQGDTAIINAQNAIRSKLADWIPKILSAQESDGYLHTWTTLGNKARWTDRAAHEGYTAGYFLEAAMAHYRMTGFSDPTLYNAARRLADCWYNNIGPSPKRSWWDGHQELEQALTRFARFVNERDGLGQGTKYAQLAKFLLDVRNGGGQYDQSHTYPVNQTEAVGHAVRAGYMYSGMTDVAILTNSSNYYNAVNVLWDNVVNRKMYVTGGLGSGETSEGFGANYSLPNNSYCESCANISNLYFQHMMHLAYQDGKYADLMELVLYNGVLGGLALDGNNFTYTNPLDQSHARYGWHFCPCCVGNLPKNMLNLPTWMYSKNADTLFVNMFIGSTVSIPNMAGTTVQLVQSTDYPWNGNVSITVNPAAARAFTIKLRVPDRSVSTLYSHSPAANGITTITVNGTAVTPTISKGYASITRTWNAGDRIDLVLPLAVQRVKAVSQVTANVGRVALQYGPLIYNIEAVDHNNVNVDGLILSSGASLTTQWNAGLLGGVTVIRGTFSNGATLTAIPNYARNNRGGRSLVWMRDQ